ncbi:carboxylate-amine ligase [Cellulomonas phragmiteti]|uniref:Putative glutamate--cysteine ligase 2 n=1 Tax=Cellulomonas phragmiteti TaxID=478780 RepID=A0ABQ4DKR0_9CELL|nr:glutamate--cysteine ligase [Cellulomonas phragmiteti]GIG39935.1 putative glutamate--cysteine ligase 2 [Cellulomonas phragmiteti]
MGVEEEYLLVDSGGVPSGVADAAVRAHERSGGEAADEGPPGGGLEHELQEQQVETGTHPCLELTDLAAEVRDGRARAASAARQAGAHLAALATSPMPGPTTLTHGARYEALAQAYALTVRDQLTSGCHVHVSVADDDEGVAVLDRIGPWLPVLLALSVNSPYWRGEDTGYFSIRSQMWNRWPTAGPTAPFGSAQAYRDTVAGLIATGVALDPAMMYFDARLSPRYPTVEIRVADVCLRADDAVLVAALSRALVETAARQAADGVPPGHTRVEPLRAATWRAGRSGLSGDLLVPPALTPVPARDAVAALLDHVRPALTDSGDLASVQDLLGRLWQRGTGADEQRAWAREGGLPGVVEQAVAATVA